MQTLQITEKLPFLTVYNKNIFPRCIIASDLSSTELTRNFTKRYEVYSKTALDTALDKVPAYKSWKKLDPGKSFNTDFRYSSLPSLTKQEIRRHLPVDMLTPEKAKEFAGALAEDEISLIETSGTTDDKITNIWYQKWWDKSEKASWKYNKYAAISATGNHREAVLANPLNVGILSNVNDLPMDKRLLSRFLYLNEKSDPTSWTPDLMNRMIEELSIFRPAVLEANPSLLARLCRYLYNTGKQVYQPEIIILTYEYTSILYKEQISRIFNSPMVSSYGTTETSSIFMQCEAGKYHQNVDFCRVDLLPVKTISNTRLTGKILATPFNNPWCYYIRFDTGDLATLEKNGKCECGRNNGIILDRLNGRAVNLTASCDGQLVTLFDLDNTVCRLKNIDDYKLRQTGPQDFDLYIVSSSGNKNTIRANAAELLKGLYGQNARINIIFETDLAPEINGKYMISKALFPIDLAQQQDK